MYTEVTPLHEGWRYQWCRAAAATLSGVQAGTVHCATLVSYPHILRKAFAGYRQRTKAGANGADILRLFRSDAGGALAQLAADVVLADGNEANPITKEFALTAADQAEMVGPSLYVLEVTLDNAGDALANPCLQLGIMAVPPGPA